MANRWGLAAVGASVAVIGGLILIRDGDDGDVTAGDQSVQPGPDEEARLPVAPAGLASNGASVLVVGGAPGSDVTLHDGSSGEVTWTGDLPFEDPTAYPGVAAVGDGMYVVSGVPCSSAEPDNDTAVACLPGGVSLALFDPERRSFSIVKVDGFEGSTPFVKVLGGDGAELVLQVGGELHRVQVEGGAVSPVDTPPLDGLDFACVVGDQVIAVDRREGLGDVTPEPGEMVVEESRPFVPVDVAVLDPVSGTWAKVGGPAAEYDTTETFELGCAARGLAVVPSERPMVETLPYVTHVFDIRTRTWVDLPPPPVEFLAAGPFAADDDVIVLSVSSDLDDADTSLLLLDLVKGTWVDEPGDHGSTAMATAYADGVFWSIPNLEDAGSLTTRRVGP